MRLNNFSEVIDERAGEQLKWCENCFLAAETENGTTIPPVSTEKGLAHPPRSPDLKGKGLFQLAASAFGFRHHASSSTIHIAYIAKSHTLSGSLN